MRALVLTSIILLAAAPTALRAQETGDPRAGHAFAQQICAVCHAIEKGQARSANARAPAFTAIAGVPGMTAAALRSSLQSSHRTMPNLILSAEELRDVVAYILSLQ